MFQTDTHDSLVAAGQLSSATARSREDWTWTQPKACPFKMGS